MNETGAGGWLNRGRHSVERNRMTAQFSSAQCKILIKRHVKCLFMSPVSLVSFCFSKEETIIQLCEGEIKRNILYMNTDMYEGKEGYSCEMYANTGLALSIWSI